MKVLMVLGVAVLESRRPIRSPCEERVAKMVVLLKVIIVVIIIITTTTTDFDSAFRPGRSPKFKPSLLSLSLSLLLFG